MGGRAQKKKAKLRDRKAMMEVLAFLLRFNLLMIPFYAVIIFGISFYPGQQTFTSIVGWVLNSLGIKTTAFGVFLFVEGISAPINISTDCIGWKSSYSLFSLVFATKGKTKDKIKFLAKWVPFLIVLNFVRVMTSIFSGLLFGEKYIYIVHTYVWQALTLLAVLGVWNIWVKGLRKQ